MQVREKYKIIPNNDICKHNLSIEEKQTMPRLAYEHSPP